MGENQSKCENNLGYYINSYILFPTIYFFLGQNKKLEKKTMAWLVTRGWLGLAVGLCNVAVNSKTAHPPPPGQSPGIWLALSPVQWGIWPKMRPTQWGIWLSCQHVCQGSKTKGFRNSLIQDVIRVHGSLLLSIPRESLCCCRFI